MSAYLRRFGSLSALVWLALAAGGWWVWLYQRDQALLLRGTQLFTGATALPGTLASHDQALPTLASRCINCHQTDRTGSGNPADQGVDKVWSAETRNFGPVLSQALLLTRQVRRGGPPSMYTEAALCILLRQGLDPAHVMVNMTMPHYVATDANCKALWFYLVTRPS